MANDIGGQVAIITGASSGIGKSAAKALAQAGATVVVNHPPRSASVDKAGAVVDEIAASGGRAVAIAADVSQEDQVEAMMKQVLDRFDIDLQRCLFCGLCEEGCPTEPKSIWLTTKTYELASYDRWKNLYVDMDELQEWKVRPAYTDEEIA